MGIYKAWKDYGTVRGRTERTPWKRGCDDNYWQIKKLCEGCKTLTKEEVVMTNGCNMFTRRLYFLINLIGISSLARRSITSIGFSSVADVNIFRIRYAGNERKILWDNEMGTCAVNGVCNQLFGSYR